MAQIKIEDERSEQEIRETEETKETACSPEEDTAAGETQQAADAAQEEQGGEEAEPEKQDSPEGTDQAGEAQQAEAAEAEEAPGEEEQKEGGLKGLFRKKDKKDKKDLQIEELTDRVRRQLAEFDNFRKRTEKEKAAMFEVGARSVIEKILPVVDNFERGLATAENREDPFVEGMEKIYKQLMTMLEGMEVKPIEAVGKEFNPDLHNAVMHVDDESVGENIVVEELQKGYMYRDSVVRYSMVKVAN